MTPPLTPATRLGEMLRLYRTVRKVTLRQMAPDIGIAAATLMRIEHGESFDAATKILSDADLLLELELEVVKHESDSAAATALSVTRGHLSRVLSRQKPMTARLALRLGYVQQRCYIPVKRRTR